MAKLEIHQFPCLSDNYGYLVHDSENNLTATIDTPEVAPINRALEERGWSLTHILNTHHHFDHAGGNLELKDRWNCQERRLEDSRHRRADGGRRNLPVR
jgi:hydroxyacylglutathione hydrolase